MKNIQLLDFPSFRHSDLKYTNKRLKILSTKFYYKNLSINFFKLIKEFKTRKYSEVFHDEKKFYLFRKKKLFSRSEILESIIKKIIKKKYLKILDFGCNKGNLLFKLKKKKYKYLYGYDINRHFKKNFENSDIQFSSNLNFKKNFFDYIIFSHSISYVPNLEKTLKLIRKISKTNALLIFNLQNVETRPHNLLFSDQRYHFNKKMIQNFFGSYGSINFISENALNHEFVFTLKLEKKNKHNKKKK